MQDKDSEEIQDPLKELDQIYEPDVRQRSFVGDLDDRHAALKSIVLNEAVPIEVRQLFETAKNLSLYSWFVYRFHQVSELIAFSALEMALRERYLKENHNAPRNRLGLYKLLQFAKSEGWITNDGFPSSYERAKYLAEHEKAMEVMRDVRMEEGESYPIEEPTEEEISEVLSRLDLVSAIADNAHKIRNDLAHGSSTLHPHSISTLTSTSEVINQIYP